MLEHPGNNKQSTFWVEGFVFEKIWKTNHPPPPKKNEFNSEAYKLRALVEVITEHWICKIMRSVIKHMHEWTKIRSVLRLYRIAVQKFSAKLQLAAVYVFLCACGVAFCNPLSPFEWKMTWIMRSGCWDTLYWQTVIQKDVFACLKKATMKIWSSTQVNIISSLW